MRVAVFGASGFVGSTLVERLLRGNHKEVRILIHSPGNAWRLARREIDFHLVDILSRNEVRTSLKDCTHVVNCTRGPKEVMLKGLHNLLKESRAQGIQRFIHLSSVSVYGNPPSPESQYEWAKPTPIPQSYGWLKLQQDNMVTQAHQGGLSCIILCPPNISGIYSSFVLSVLNDMRNGTLALVDGGRMALNTVDVENLCYAVELALTSKEADGQRIFITDAEPITWKDFTDALMPLTEREEPLPEITREEIPKSPSKSKKGRLSLFNAMKHLVSSSVREALREDPLLEKIDHFMRRSIGLLPEAIEDHLRRGIEGPIHLPKIDIPCYYSSRYNAIQLRGVHHSCERAKKVLGYEPLYTFKESMNRFSVWYKLMYGFGSEDWQLIREIENQ